MASGDVVYETQGTEGFDVHYFAKPVVTEDYAWEVHLKCEDPYGPQAEVVMKGNTLGGVFPPFTNKQYKITITEV